MGLESARQRIAGPTYIVQNQDGRNGWVKAAEQAAAVFQRDHLTEDHFLLHTLDGIDFSELQTAFSCFLASRGIVPPAQPWLTCRRTFVVPEHMVEGQWTMAYSPQGDLILVNGEQYLTWAREGCDQSKMMRSFFHALLHEATHASRYSLATHQMSPYSKVPTAEVGSAGQPPLQALELLYEGITEIVAGSVASIYLDVVPVLLPGGTKLTEDSYAAWHDNPTRWKMHDACETPRGFAVRLVSHIAKATGLGEEGTRHMFEAAYYDQERWSDLAELLNRALGPRLMGALVLKDSGWDLRRLVAEYPFLFPSEQPSGHLLRNIRRLLGQHRR